MMTFANALNHVSVPLSIKLLGVAALLWLPAQPATAQEPADLIPVYGFDDDEFIIGAWVTKWALTDTANAFSRDVRYIWKFIDAMGLNVMFANASAGEVDLIYNSQFREEEKHRYRTPAAQKVYQAAYARGIRFFPFDSVQVKIRWVIEMVERGWYFFSTPGGTLETNAFHGVPEKSYSNLADTGLVAHGIVFNSTDTLSARSDEVIKRCEQWFTAYKKPGEFVTGDYPETYYFTVIGHLGFDETPSDDTVFTVAIYHEIPADQRYLDDNFDTVTNGSTRMELLVDSFAVVDSDLHDADQFDRLSYISHPVNLRYRLGNTSLPGPRHPYQPRGSDGEDSARHTHSIDIRVYWTGAKEASLHAVELRDSIGELILGTSQASIDTREAILNDAKRFLYGSAQWTIDSLRTDIIGLECGTEPFYKPFEFAGFQAVHEMLKKEFNLPDYRVANGQPANPQQGDSIGVLQYDSFARQTLYLTENNRIHTYFYWSDPRDTVREFSSIQGGLLDMEYLELPLHQIPRIRQRNGGRFHLPELLDLDSVGIPSYDITLAARIDTYDEMVQRAQIGRHDPGNKEFYFDTVRSVWPRVLRYKLPGMANYMAESARASLKTGKPFVPLPGSMTHLVLRDRLDTIADPDTVVIDTISSPNPTESELFATVGMLLGYGARGITWFTLGSLPKAHPSLLDNSKFVSDPEHCCWGSNGYFTKDTTHNVLRPLELKRDYPWTGPFWGEVLAEIPAVYMGWRDGTRAVKKINHWLARIGPELLKLRWREGYSMHFSVPWPGKQFDTVFRPYDTSEILSSIRTRSPFSQEWDSAHRTFVEVGFFEKVTDSSNGVYNPVLDRHHAFLTNRRTFRKPLDTCWSGWCGNDTIINGDTIFLFHFDRSVNILDTLAGTRVIEATLNLEHPDTTAYNFWRVREIEPDIEPLPHQPLTSRWVLDTIVHGDSAFNVVLGPGRSTLLEITPTWPDSSLVAGDLRFPGQKKFMFDGRRYHAVYHKARTLPGSGTDNVVVWRISLPLSDTTGAIRWLNNEIVLSDNLTPGDTVRTDNRFASMTLKRSFDTVRVHAVWSAHPAQLSPPNDREIVARNAQAIDIASGIIGSPSMNIFFGPLHTIDWHAGTDAEQWGTPVVSMTDGATVFAWSDSVIGIVGRLYPYSPLNYTVGAFNPTLSARDSISWISTQTNGFAGQYPSMPPYTRLHAADSTVGIVWRQPGPVNQSVLINRLKHTPGDALVNVNPAGSSITPWNGLRFYPSIDLNQDTGSVMIDEGVTWEDDFLSYKAVYFQALETDPIGQITTQTARSGLIVLEDDSVMTWPKGELYPQGSSIGAHDTSAAGSGREQYAVAYARPMTQDLWLSLVYWDDATFHGSWPQQYTYSGAYPNTLYDPTRIWSNTGVMYQVEPVGGVDSTVKTSRQFFGKLARPTGYVAQGRTAWFRDDDSSETGYHVMWYDPWQVTGTSGEGIALVERSTAPGEVDTLTDLESLFRTAYFDVGDTLLLGYRFDAIFSGDSLSAAGGTLDCLVELVDSASGLVVELVDSVRLSPENDSIRIDAAHLLVPLAGTYSLRVRFVTGGFSVDTVEHDMKYPVWEVAGYVKSPATGKLIAGNGVAGESSARLSVRPNPVTGSTRVVVALDRGATVKLNLLAPSGALVRAVRTEVRLESGVHVFDLDVEGIPSGAYLLELRAGEDRAVQQVVILQ